MIELTNFLPTFVKNIRLFKSHVQIIEKELELLKIFGIAIKPFRFEKDVKMSIAKVRKHFWRNNLKIFGHKVDIYSMIRFDDHRWSKPMIGRIGSKVFKKRRRYDKAVQFFTKKKCLSKSAKLIIWTVR